MVRTQVVKIDEGLYLLRLDDDETMFFEALWSIPEGVTYNAYVIAGNEGVVLLDTWKGCYAELYLEALRSVADPRDVTDIVIHHVEPDHTGALPKVLELCRPDVKVWGHPMAKQLIEAFYGVKPSFHAVKDGEKAVLAGEQLVFFHTPWLHWPDTIMSYLVNKKVLFTGDAFGAFSIPPGIYDDSVKVEEYEYFVRKYIACIIGKYKSFIIKNIDKLRKAGLEIRIIAPLHGVLWKKELSKIIELYERIAQTTPRERKAVAIYGSMYGDVEKCIEAVKEELSSSGYEVKVFRYTDKQQDPLSDVLAEAVDADLLVIGAATYDASVFPTVEHVVNTLAEKIGSPKRVVVISSYGWGPVAGKKIAMILEKAGFNAVKVIEYRGSPRPDDIEKARGAVREVAEA